VDIGLAQSAITIKPVRPSAAAHSSRY
jgi:hypothetical protein